MSNKKKKWKKEEVKKLILKYLVEKEETTKYRIQKDLRIPLATILQAIKDLENEGLVKYKEGKRGSHICRLTLRGLIYCLNEGIINLEGAKEFFLKILEANGITRNEIIEKLNISEKALSCYIKLYLNFLLNRFRIFGNIQFKNLNLDKIIKDIEKGRPSFDKSFLNLGWVLAVNLMEVFSRSLAIIDEFMFPVPYFIGKLSVLPYPYYCSDKELDELFSWLAKKEKYGLGTLPSDLLDNYLLEKAGKPLRVRKWVKIGCMFLHLEFDLREMFTREEITVTNSVNVIITNYIKEAQCPIDKSECNLDVFERFKCPKLKELLKEVIKE